MRSFTVRSWPAPARIGRYSIIAVGAFVRGLLVERAGLFDALLGLFGELLPAELCRAHGSSAPVSGALSYPRSQATRGLAYDVLPVTAATMIRGIALTSVAVTASATIALNSGVSVKGEDSAAFARRLRWRHRGRLSNRVP